MFKREERAGKTIGYSLESGNRFFFFGTRHLTRAGLEQCFPAWRFAFLKQVHGRAVVEAKWNASLEADGHFTDQANLALVVQSADCVPILMATSSRVCAIHSGWRGTAQDILGTAAGALSGEALQLAVIGPHILRPSFEVGSEVAEQLLSAAPPGNSQSSLVYPHSSADKRFFDLTELVRLQLRHHFGRNLETFECLYDSKTNLEFHSYRRDREQAERQFSFVVIKA